MPDEVEEVEEEEEDLADMMAEDDGSPIVIKITEEEFKACQVVIRKIVKASKLFPEDPFFQSPDYQQLDKMRLVQLQKIYQDIVNRARDGDEIELYTVAYAGAVKFTEDLLTRKVGLNVSGLTDTLMANPSVRLNLKLIELEYGLEQQFGMEMTPARALLASTIVTTFMVYNHNKEGGESPQIEFAQPPPKPPVAAPMITTPVQIEYPKEQTSLQPQGSEQFRASLSLLDKLKGNTGEKVK